jgi:hypothetical protein
MGRTPEPSYTEQTNHPSHTSSMLLRKEAIQRQIFHSMVEISKVKLLPRPIRNLELVEVDVSVQVEGSELDRRKHLGLRLTIQVAHMHRISVLGIKI